MIAISSTDRRAQTVDKSGAAASRANGPASSAGTARPAPCAEVAESSGGMITLRLRLQSNRRRSGVASREEKALRKRQFGRTGWSVSEIGFGAWAIGASWGPVKDVDSLDALRVSLDEGVDFLDTADVYGDHASERLISRILKERKKQGKSVPIVAIRLCGHVRESDAGCGHGRRHRQDRCRAREDEISGRCLGGAPIFQRQASGDVCDRSF